MSSISSQIVLFASELFTIECRYLFPRETVVDAIAPFVLIGSFSDSLVTRKGIKSLTSLILGQIGRIAFELLALERRTFFP